jgi:TolB-like protein
MARSLHRSDASTLAQPSEAEVRAHLAQLLGSDALAISERNRRFLSYIVEETLAGRGDRIKAYNVALTAFDRTDDFDPQTDPIVRIEASRLRRALEHYYLTAGKADAVRVAIPKGSYVAEFSKAVPDPIELREAAPPIHPVETERGHRLSRLSARRPAIWGFASLIILALVGLAWLLPILIAQAVNGASAAARPPSLLVLPFESGTESQHAFIARGITAELIRRLTPQETLAVLGPQAKASDPDYVLSGSADVMDGKVYISAILANSRSGRYLWSWNVARPLGTEDLIGTEATLAGEIMDGIVPMVQPQH